MTLQRRTPLKRSTKRIRPVRERFTPEFWNAQRAAVFVTQDEGRCAHCLRRYSRLDACHIRGLGKGRSRNDPDNPLNALTNLLGLCRPCHGEFDDQPLATRIVVGNALKSRFRWPEN